MRVLLAVFSASLALLFFFGPTAALAQGTEEVLTNDKVLGLMKAGLEPDLVMLKIQQSKTNFNLSSDELIRLRKEGLPTEVLKCMMDPSNCAQKAATPGNPNPLATTTPASTTPAAAAAPAPKEQGAYWIPDNGDPQKMTLRTIAQGKVGGRLGSVLTVGIKSAKNKAYLLGPTSKLLIRDRQPTFRVTIPPDASIDDYVIVQMDAKEDRREVEIGSKGGIVGSKQGLRFELIQQTDSVELEPGVFKITPRAPMKAGEYIIYILGSADADKGISGRGFDFTID
ncbi:MAG: hypothetical protein EHM61_15355 [Acidobacteria bacterium]|nr:MAG: hypothetical protein EHM61_15355 [Acidobacteriota bacterium]